MEHPRGQWPKVKAPKVDTLVVAGFLPSNGYWYWTCHPYGWLMDRSDPVIVVPIWEVDLPLCQMDQPFPILAQIHLYNSSLHLDRRCLSGTVWSPPVWQYDVQREFHTFAPFFQAMAKPKPASNPFMVHGGDIILPSWGHMIDIHSIPFRSSIAFRTHSIPNSDSPYIFQAGWILIFLGRQPVGTDFDHALAPTKSRRYGGLLDSSGFDVQKFWQPKLRRGGHRWEKIIARWSDVRM